MPALSIDYHDQFDPVFRQLEPLGDFAHAARIPERRSDAIESENNAKQVKEALRQKVKAL